MCADVDSKVSLSSLEVAVHSWDANHMRTRHHLKHPNPYAKVMD